MNETQTFKCLIGGMIALLAFFGMSPVHAQQTIEPQTFSLVAQGPTRFDVNEGGGSVSLTFDVVFGKPANDTNTILSAYEIGIVYDPAVMTLSNFSGFQGKLGSPALDSFEDLVTDHLDNTNDSLNNPANPAINSVWDYRADSVGTGLGAYNGKVPGTPGITGQYVINEGSLRFTEVSFLPESELETLQTPATSDAFTLFSLTFDVDTTQQHRTDVLFVDDRFYDGWNTGGGGSLDVKLNDGFTGKYLTFNDARVSVPLPGTVLLLLPGLFLMLRLNAGRRMSA